MHSFIHEFCPRPLSHTLFSPKINAVILRFCKSLRNTQLVNSITKTSCKSPSLIPYVSRCCCCRRRRRRRHTRRETNSFANVMMMKLKLICQQFLIVVTGFVLLCYDMLHTIKNICIVLCVHVCVFCLITWMQRLAGFYNHITAHSIVSSLCHVIFASPHVAASIQPKFHLHFNPSSTSTFSANLFAIHTIYNIYVSYIYIQLTTCIHVCLWNMFVGVDGECYPKSQFYSRYI